MLSKLVAAVSIFLVLKEFARHMKMEREDEQLVERHDGIPATDEDCSSTRGLQPGILDRVATALAGGRASSPEVVQDQAEPALLFADLALKRSVVAMEASHVVRLPCAPQCLINPYVRKEVVVLALNRFMTPVLLSVTAPVLLLDGELSAILDDVEANSMPAEAESMAAQDC